MRSRTTGEPKRSWTGAIPCVLMLICLGASGGTAAFAQNARLHLSHLDKLAGKATEVTNVDLEGPMLKMAGEAAAQKSGLKGAAVQNMLQRLKGVYVRSFEFSKPGEYTRADVEDILKQIKSGGWKAMVHVEDKKSGETTGVYLLEEGGQTIGMAVVAAEPTELTVVNLVGPIDFSELGGLGNLGALGQLGMGGKGNGSKPQLQHRDGPDPHVN